MPCSSTIGYRLSASPYGSHHHNGVCTSSSLRVFVATYTIHADVYGRSVLQLPGMLRLCYT